MTTTLQFDRIPSTLPLFAQLAVAKGRPDRVLKAPMEARATGVVAQRSAVREYLAVCGGEEGLGLPLLYPQVMSNPLSMALMAHGDFPLPALGLVHLQNTVTQVRAPHVGEPMDFRVRIDTIERTERGYEFDMISTVDSEGGETIWTGVARILSRARHKDAPKAAREPRQPPQPSDWPLRNSYRLDAAQGRRYARVSGDYNPIHLSAPSARLLGFKRAIIHGMWSAATIAAELEASDGRCRFSCEFKTPLFLPGQANLHARATGASTAFLLQDARSFRPILSGEYAHG